MVNPRTRARRQAGFTLLEVAISATILVTIFLMAFRLIGGAQTQLGTTNVTMADTQAAHIAEMILQRMRGGVVATLEDSTGVPIPDGGTSTNGFRIRVIVKSPGPMYQGAVMMGESVGFALQRAEAFDGVDNDNDNLVDEFKVVLQQWPGAAAGSPQFSPPIEDNVRSLTVRRTGSRVTITVAIERYDSANRQVRAFTGTAAFALRN